MCEPLFGFSFYIQVLMGTCLEPLLPSWQQNWSPHFLGGPFIFFVYEGSMSNFHLSTQRRSSKVKMSMKMTQTLPVLSQVNSQCFVLAFCWAPCSWHAVSFERRIFCGSVAEKAKKTNIAIGALDRNFKRILSESNLIVKFDWVVNIVD